MITQELIDYVKTQLSAGTSPEQITSDLLNQGWTAEQINEAFQARQKDTPAQVPQQETVLEMTQAPKHIKYFEWLMYASFTGQIVIWLFQFVTNDFLLNLISIAATPLIGLLIRLLFVYQIVYKRASWARIALTVLFALGFFGTVASIFFILSNPILLITVIPSLLEIAAIYFVFTKESNGWLAQNKITTITDSEGNLVTVDAPSTEKGNIWNKAIPRSNWISAIFASGFFFYSVFGVGGGLDVFNNSTLGGFAYMMLWTMIGFGVFVLLENFVFRASLKDRPSSSIDKWIMGLISVRNFFTILSVIPLIQLLGMGAIALGGVPWLIAYLILIVRRFRK